MQVPRERLPRRISNRSRSPTPNHCLNVLRHTHIPTLPKGCIIPLHLRPSLVIPSMEQMMRSYVLVHTSRSIDARTRLRLFMIRGTLNLQHALILKEPSTPEKIIMVWRDQVMGSVMLTIVNRLPLQPSSIPTSPIMRGRIESRRGFEDREP